MQKIAFILFVLSVLFDGCSVVRKRENIGMKPEEETMGTDFLESVRKNNISNYNFYIQKADISLSENGKIQRFIASIKYKITDTLLLSIRTKVGLEAVRLFMTKDTIFINDRINKHFLYGDPGFINLKYGIEPTLLYVLLGDFMAENHEEKEIIECLSGIYENEFFTKGKKIEYAIDCKKKKTVSALFEDTFETEGIVLYFRNFFAQGYILFPGIIEIENSSGSTKIKIEINKVEINWNGKIEFIPGNKYDVIRLK